MSIASVVTRGFGSGGSIPFVVTRGYGVGEAAPAVAVVTGGRSDGRRRKPRKIKRFSVFDHIDRSLAAIDSRVFRANELAQQQEDVTPIIAEHFGIETKAITPIQYRTVSLSSLAPRIESVDWGAIANAKMLEEERAILMILQKIL